MDKKESAHGAKIPVAISSCLLGSKSRYDLSDKSIPEITNRLADHFLWVSFCPEMKIGLGAPREKLNLIVKGNEKRIIGDESGIDYTHKMAHSIVTRMDELDNVCGYIFKSKSPSCGISGDTGIFSEFVSKRFPKMPMTDENELSNNGGMESFIEKVFAYHRGEHLSNA